jgi:hypothetical protein
MSELEVYANPLSHNKFPVCDPLTYLYFQTAPTNDFKLSLHKSVTHSARHSLTIRDTPLPAACVRHL